MFSYIIKYTIGSVKGSVGGKNDNYDIALKTAQSIVKNLFSNAVLSEKYNDLVASPDYLVYENGKDKIFLEITKES